MHIAIVGAGAAGLAAARHALAEGFTCVAFERAGRLGGTWVYTDSVGFDQNGFPVYSSMYQNLRTNLPKEVMGYPDFPIPDQERSYLKQEEILNFLELYADNFGLRRIIQFHKNVQNVEPIEHGRWLVRVIDVETLTETSEVFDAVMVCNGHYNDPIMPVIQGMEVFKGKQMHSHDYRKPDGFAGQNVLVVGAGPSGMDLALQISRRAKQVFLSHHMKDPIKTQYPGNVFMKPDVRRLTETEAVFADGTASPLDAICYCTGYKYNFPFLDAKCGVTVDDNYISPLYKHMVNISHPTMCFIGIPFNVCAFQMFDLQVRYYMQALSGHMRLPSTRSMAASTARDMAARWLRGYGKRQAHMMGADQSKYYEELATAAGVAPILPVIVKLRDESARRILDDLIHFRDDKYRIISDSNYVKITYAT